jgi:hypothetical protein
MLQLIRFAPDLENAREKASLQYENLYLDIDSEGKARLAEPQNSDSVPKRAATISTSPNKYQVLWRVKGFDFVRQESTLKLLALAFGDDPACTDCKRILRGPGFFNLKYDPAHRITVQYSDANTSNADDFRLDVPAKNEMPSKPHIPGRKHPGKQSNSELDWARVLHELAAGKDPIRLTRELASQRSDKPSPLYCAQRTVDVASARLWFMEGRRFDDLVTMLEVRCRFEIQARPRASDCPHGATHAFAHKVRLISLPEGEQDALAQIHQTRKISTSGGSNSAHSSYPQRRHCGRGRISREGSTWGRVRCAVASGKSVIHLGIHSQKRNGASHRVYFDTPPLKGLRLEPFRFRLETDRAAST